MTFDASRLRLSAHDEEKALWSAVTRRRFSRRLGWRTNCRWVNGLRAGLARGMGLGREGRIGKRSQVCALQSAGWVVRPLDCSLPRSGCVRGISHLGLLSDHGVRASEVAL